MEYVNHSSPKHFSPADSERRLTVALDLLITFLQRQSVDASCHTNEPLDEEGDEAATSVADASSSETMPQTQPMVMEAG
jgi:hypothetical protein